MPTLAALTGCPLDRDVHGLDLSEVLKDADAPLRELYYSQCQEDPRQAAMVTAGRWKDCWAQRGPT